MGIFLPKKKHQHNWNISRPTVCYQKNIRIDYNISGDQWWSTSLRVSKLMAVVMKSFSASSMTSTQLITILPTFFVTNLTNCPCYHPRCMLRAAVGVRSSIVQQVVDRSGRLDPIWYSDIMLYQSLYSISVVSVTSMVISDYISYIACRHQIGINWIEYRELNALNGGKRNQMYPSR